MGTTVSTELVDEGDRRGRQGRKFIAGKRRWELLAACGESGVTRAEFARREGIKYTTLCNWVQREGKADGRTEAPATMHFAEVAAPRRERRGLEVRLAD